VLQLNAWMVGWSAEGGFLVFGLVSWGGGRRVLWGLRMVGRGAEERGGERRGEEGERERKNQVESLDGSFLGWCWYWYFHVGNVGLGIYMYNLSSSSFVSYLCSCLSFFRATTVWPWACLASSSCRLRYVVGFSRLRSWACCL
jgi:hypothetical protein